MNTSPLHSLLIAGAGIAAAGAVMAAAFSLEREGSGYAVTDNAAQKSESAQEAPSFYRDGDWYKYALSPEYQIHDEYGKETEEEVSFETDSSASLSGAYGWSWFTNEKYKLYDEDRPVSRIIGTDFEPSNEIKIMLQGHAGKRLNVYIDYDSERESMDENIYRMQYHAVKDDETVREINAGDIVSAMDRSHYAMYDGRNIRATGVNTVIKKGDLTLKGFASVAKGGDETEVFRGTSSSSYSSVAEYQYIRNTYFQLEPYKRYDGITDSAAVVFPAAYSSLTVFTSAPADPQSYALSPVELEKSSVEIWLDEQQQTVHTNGVVFSPDGGSYVRLAEGSDYSVNYLTGVITFIRSIPYTARIIAGYRLAGGSLSSSDPSARTDIISGKIAVYCKFGTQTDEDPDRNGISDGDVNSDGRINHDVYEIRSAYMIGDRGILSDRFAFTLYNKNRTVTATERGRLGRFAVDYRSGILSYFLREPFRPLLDASAVSRVYGPYADTAYEVSAFTQRFDYTKDAHSFQLKHMNIIEGSVTVKVNGTVLSPSLYTVNPLSGTVEFTDTGNPVLTDTTPVEISYQYTQKGFSSRGFTGGVRGDYRFNEIFSTGGSFLYNRSNTSNVIPLQGEEPTQNLVFEGDAQLDAGPAKFSRMADLLTGGYIDSVPLQLKGYAEYARSVYDTNTFGKMLVDDMESDADISPVSMSERDWILSSMPAAQLPSDRAQLLYKYYRSLSSTGTLHGLSFSPYSIPYTTRPGPYNVADGHVAYTDSDMNESRRSLVFDADFSGGQFAAAATRIGDGKGSDLSGLQYVEIWYRSAGGSGSVDLSLDIGSVNEDSDGDGVYDTEDSNRNGYLDRDPSRGIDEDAGYLFNPSGLTATRVGGGPNLNSVTRGDGTLTSEDLNSNGMLDTAESVLSFPGTRAWADTVSAYAPMTVNLADTSWKHARIYLQRNNLTESEKNILRNARSLRLVLHGSGASSAVIHIDALRLVSSRWKDIRINGIPDENSALFKTRIVDSLLDMEYRVSSFMREKKKDFTDMYGERTDSEILDEQESALELSYSLAGAQASVTRFFQKSLDLRRYHTLGLWINARELTAGDRMTIRLCSSDSDYYEYAVPLDGTLYWKEITCKLDDESKGALALSSVSGSPDRGSISKITVSITGATGRVWINAMTASDPAVLNGGAYWCEGSLNVTRPLYVTAQGTAVGKDLLFTALRRSHGRDYISPGRTDFGQSDAANEFKTSVEIIPGLRSSGSALFSRQNVDSSDPAYAASERGETSKNLFGFTTEYRTGKEFSPVFSIAYNGENYENRRIDVIGLTRGTVITGRTVHSPKLMYAQTVSGPFSGVWNFNASADTSFSDSSASRRASGAVVSGDEQDFAETDRDQRQKNDLQLKGEYVRKHLFLSSSVGVFSHEIVSYSGNALSDGGILSPVSGSYHIPFMTDESSRFVERTTQSGFRWGLKDHPSCSFSDAYDFTYGQNLFRDYTSGEKTLYQGFSRSHGSSASASHTVALPFTFIDPLLGCIRSAGLTYGRKIGMSETGVPFEGEKTGWGGDRYGIKNSAAALLPELYNHYSLPPWKYFTGRGNFAGGRDHINSLKNTPVYVSGSAVSGYNNSLSLSENASASAGFVFKGVTVNSDASIRQVCERASVLSVPGQQVTAEGGVDCSVNLMDIFSFGFFRPNADNKPFHAARWTTGYAFTRTMIITDNIREDSHKPDIGLSLMSGSSSVSAKFGLDIRRRTDYDFIAEDYNRRSRADDPYYNAMTLTDLREHDTGYLFSIRYDTDLPFFYKWMMQYYTLTAMPLFSLEYALLLNRYDYSNAVSPEPYDQHLVTGKCSFDVHKNIRGGITGRWALERWYSRDTHGLYREITSADISFNITLLF